MLNATASLNPTIARLESLFSIFNDHFYSGQLTKPVITVSPDTHGAYGWCTGWKAWGVMGEQTDGYYEINVCAEYLCRPFEQVCETLLHEMVHLYDIQTGVKDTSRGGTYHNRNFKKAAEEHGLVCAHDEKYGWAKTSLNDDARQLIDSMTEKSFELCRISPKKRKKTASKSLKYVCPACGAIVRATRIVNVSCEDCYETMICTNAA